MIVAGSAIFGRENVSEALLEMKKIAEQSVEIPESA